MQPRALLATLPLLLAPSAANALGATINPGIIISGVVGPQSAFALGGEASFMLWPSSGVIQDHIGVGGFFQAQAYNFDHGRYAFGLQAGSLIGGELGWAYRERSATTAWQQGVHAAIFGSLGIIVGSVRVTLPITDGADPTHPAPGWELAFCLSLKAPIPVGNIDVYKNAFGSGRFLRDGERTLAASIVARDGARYDDCAMARAWARDAQVEHASVPSFLRLAGELRALGAPLALVDRAVRAALEEVAHANDCFAIASRHAGTVVSPSGWPEAPPRAPNLERIAVEAWVDGCIGERAAALAAREASSTADPSTRAALSRIARDEAGHARLAWDVLQFALAKGGGPVARAVTRSQLAPVPIDDPEIARLDSRGRVSHARAIALRDRVARDAKSRLASMVRAHA